MKNFQSIFIKAVSYFFILLFMYASVSKMLDFENFQVQIAQSPLLSAYAGSISYSVIISELIIALLLCIRKSRLLGLLASFGIMIAFTVYIYLILYYSEFVPCSCGGILENMGWITHLIFNIITVILAGSAIILSSNSIKNSEMIRSLSVRIWFMAGSFLSGAGIVIYLFYSSEYIIKKENNFTRRFLNHPILQEYFIDLGIDSYYFAGVSGDFIYLANKTSPFQILKIDLELTSSQLMSIVPEGNFTFKSISYEIFAKEIFAFDGSVPVIYKAPITDSIITLKTISLKDAFFSQMVTVDSVNFALRTRTESSTDNVLGLLNLNSEPKVRINKNILSAKTQNIFDTDGKLLFDKSSKELYYIFFYRNQILKINKSLNLIETMKTIDTTSVSNIETIKLKDGTIKMSRPPQVNNLSTTIHKGLIFNKSGLMGKYEPKESWKSSSIIDIYKVNTTQYWGSFYVQHRGGKSLSHMLVTDHYLFALVGNDLIRYKLRQPITGGMNGVMPKNHKKE